jgi:hypothetical protein
VDALGDDVEALPAPDDADGNHTRLQGRHVAGADRLQRLDGLSRHDDGIHAVVGPGSVRLGAQDLDVEVVHRCERGPRRVADAPDIELGGRVEAEYRLGRRIPQHAIRHHQLGAPLLAGRRALLGGLEDELHRARQLVPQRRQHRGDAELDRGVDVVPACMHDAHLLVQVGRSHRGLERKVGPLRHRERIHVGADRDDRPGLPSAKHAHDARMGDLGADLIEAQGLQVVRHQFRRLDLAIPELWVLVYPVPLFDDLGDESIYRRFDAGREPGLSVGASRLGPDLSRRVEQRTERPQRADEHEP